MAAQPSHEDEPPHSLLLPLTSPGHIMPMADLARLLAAQGTLVSLVAPPKYAARFAPLARAGIRLLELPLLGEPAGLPPGCEGLDELPSLALGTTLFAATRLTQQPAEALFSRLKPRPNCIISDVCLPWTARLARKFDIPRIIFQPHSCLLSTCLNGFQYLPEILNGLSSDSDSFVWPGLAHRVEFTKPQVHVDPDPKMMEFRKQISAAEKESYGVIVNTFEELESEYVEELRKSKNGKVWCVGPVSLCNKTKPDQYERGNKASIGQEQCSKWLDAREPRSVLYACLGSLCSLVPAQLIELGSGLEASNHPFIWVIRERNQTVELEEWISGSGFEEKVAGRGLIIRGWAPQVFILSHQAVGGFLTHCGWNSSLEAICAGVPVATWPMFGDQFFNEKLLVDILGVGVSVGVQKMVDWGKEEETGVVVNSESVRVAISELMGGSARREERRNRVKNLAGMASKALQQGGSSHLDLSLLIKEIVELAKAQRRTKCMV